jgi:hypothetical protein
MLVLFYLLFVPKPRRSLGYAYVLRLDQVKNMGVFIYKLYYVRVLTYLSLSVIYSA